FVKIIYTRRWIENLFEGISGIEVGLLQEIYDGVEPFPKGTIEETAIDFSFGDGTVQTYRVYNIFSKEGIFFLYKNRGRSEELKTGEGFRQG
ncbi:MAG: hypothetical protein PVG99_09115, partial [Desulfobacteraceae bacterium]